MPMERFFEVVGQVSTADSLASLQAAIRSCARQLIGADGVALVLRDGNLCFYAEEDAIAPLWKGKRFPMGRCISGWSMLHGEMAVIPDIYRDPRIPHEAYRPTFVKSLAMAPAPQYKPVAAIGAYWAKEHQANWAEQSALQALANLAGGVLHNLQHYERLRAIA